MARNGSSLVVEAFLAEGANTIFGYPGGAIMPLYDALYGSGVRHILTRHEQGAALAADGYARATGKVGVCLATSGPGATNLVTGIANAFLDSVPMVALTGQVARPVMGTDAFQEVDIFGITLPVVKHSYLVQTIDELPHVLREAFTIAKSGRPGPVLIDLPKDISLEATDARYTPSDAVATAPLAADHAGAVQVARELLKNSVRPLVYCGGGVGLGNAVDALRAFVDTLQLPAVSTLKGLGALPTQHPLLLGMLGMHGSRAANIAVQQCDLLICIGARFDDRATGKLAEFAPNAKVIHLDIDPAEVGKLRAPQASVIGDLTTSLNALRSDNLALPHIKLWRAQCLSNKLELAARYDAPFESVYAPSFLRDLSRAAPANTIVTCDVGQHQMWVAQHWHLQAPHHHLTSGGLGTMGYGIPAGIGAWLGCPDQTVITVTGDGSIMMNIQELATLKRYNIPLKIVLLDNQHLGMVRQWQELFFDCRYSETVLDDNPDFVEVARAFGIDGFAVHKQSQVPGAIERLLATPGPVLCHVRIDADANVWPLVPPGKPNDQMMGPNPTHPIAAAQGGIVRDEY